MQTMTKTKISTGTKQKVIIAVATVAILAGLGGLISAIGKAKGLSFGGVFFKRTTIEQKKTAAPPPKKTGILPAYNENRLCKIRSTTGGTITVPCAKIKKTE